MWVENEGGPLLVAPESELAHWGGSTGDDGPVETWGDYGRACSVRGYLGLVDVGGQQALVLGDEPAPTTYLAEERMFLRWVAADSEAELIEAGQRALQNGVQWDEDEGLMWVIREPVVLFESWLSGMELEPDNHLVIDIEPGRYRVRATGLSDHHSGAILVQLQQTSDVGDAGGMPRAV
ncbi:hypothetical protein ABIA35_001080 [Catenulispora sp. MAP12-49]